MNEETAPAAHRGELLVPLDGSARSEAALPAALALGAIIGAPVRLARVVDAPVDAASLEAGVRELTRGFVRAADGSPPRGASHAVSSVLLEGADVPHALLQHASSRGARAIVMATRSRGPVGRAVLGSVADRVVRDAPVPVVLVPPNAATAPAPRGDASPPATMRRVLVPIDESLAAQHAVDAVLALRGDAAIELVLGRVLAGPPSAGGRGAGSRSAWEATHAASAARAALERVAELLRGEGVATRARVITHASPAEGILQLARDERVGLIAMTTRARAGVARLLLGSVADAVVRGSEVPVVLVTAGEGPTR